eukprot:6017063-Alexandrium_andersonii.AAC.1
MGPEAIAASCAPRGRCRSPGTPLSSASSSACRRRHARVSARAAARAECARDCCKRRGSCKTVPELLQTREE